MSPNLSAFSNANDDSFELRIVSEAQVIKEIRSWNLISFLWLSIKRKVRNAMTFIEHGGDIIENDTANSNAACYYLLLCGKWKWNTRFAKEKY